MKNYVEVAYSKKEKPESTYPNQLASYLLERFHISEGMRILDNGCGRGDFLRAFSNLGLAAYGTDISDFCKEAVVVDLDQDCLPFSDGYFDIVFSKSVVEHLKNGEHYILEMKRVLKKGGVLILMTPDWKSQYKIFFEDPTHIHPYCVKSIGRLLEMCGFCNSGAELFYQLPVMWKYPYLKKFDVFKGSVNRVYKNKTYRFFREKMVLGWGYK